MSDEKVVRCKGCGKQIKEEDGSGSAVRIEIGRVNGDDGVVEFKRSKDWGYMHKRCFLLAIGAPIF